MEVGRPNDPNIDGDFISLWTKRDERQKADEELNDFLQNFNPNSKRRDTIYPEKILQTLKSVQPQTPKSTETAPSPISNTIVISDEQIVLRDAFFEAIDNDNVKEFSKLLEQSPKKSEIFLNPQMRHKETSCTVLNHALENNRYAVGRFLIDIANVNLLLEDYKIIVKGVSTHKSNLHILSEKGNYVLTKLLLSNITEEKTRQDYLDRVVLTELEGQRPRHLSCMHLAALHGHTEIVDLLTTYGVSIDIRNNKNDTPVLWAARGNHIETVRYFIKHGAQLHLENDKGSTPLYWAVRYGFSELVHLLAKEGGVDVNQKRKLGFYYPIFLAGALGYHEIVEILLDYKADPYVTINNNITVLHVASSEGECEVIRVLLKKTKLPVDQIDANGDTALLYAAKNAKINAMELLMKHGADVNIRNKQGQSIWDFTINYENNNFLTAVLSLYKQYSRQNTALLTFPEGQSPLHIAALKGNVEKLNCLLQQGADPKSIDLHGNTYFHIAARDDKVEILEKFLPSVSIDDVNDNGDTALHLAAKFGNIVSTEKLIAKFKLDATNIKGMTPLHEAVFSDFADSDLVKMLVSHIIKANTWSLVDAVDMSNNTALHLAAKKGRPDVINELSCLNPMITNADGETPMHIAAKSGIASNFEAMLATFNKPGSGINLDQKNDQGESCLHICVRRGDINSIIKLVASGADLSLKNKKGNSVIHMLIEEITIDNARTQTMIETYKCIVKESPKWWCMRHNQQLPSEETEMFYRQMRHAMIHLTSEIVNDSGQDAIDYAIEMGAIELLKEILSTVEVYKFKWDRYNFLYDITCILREKTGQKSHRSNSVKPTVEKLPKTTRKNKGSYLSTIVSLNDDILAAKILDITPINEIVQNYWNNYQWIYVVFLAIHIAYMILFTVYVMPSYNYLNVPGLNSLLPLQNDTSSYDEDQDPFRQAFMTFQYRSYHQLNYGLFLIWPVAILLFELFFAFSRLYHVIEKKIKSKKMEKSDNNVNISTSHIFKTFLSLFSMMIMNLGDILSYCFCICAILWYVLFMTYIHYKYYIILVSLVYLFGWIYLINFLKAIEALHVFTIMLRYIIIRNITRFIGIYVIFLLGCGMAFNALLQIHPNITEISPGLGTTIFNTVNMMLGMFSLFGDSFDENYTMYGGNVAFIKAIYIVYVLVSTVILMSLLVAMMTDTYTSVKSKEGSTWRVGSLRLALHLEDAIPFIKRIFKYFCARREKFVYDIDFDRWFMVVSQRKLTNKQKEQSESEEMIKSIQRLENKMDQFQDAFLDLSRRLESLVSEKHHSNVASKFIEAINRGSLKKFEASNPMKKRLAEFSQQNFIISNNFKKES